MRSKKKVCYNRFEKLASRDAVQKTVIEPHEEYSITVGEEKIENGGPVVI